MIYTVHDSGLKLNEVNRSQQLLVAAASLAADAQHHRGPLPLGWLTNGCIAVGGDRLQLPCLILNSATRRKETLAPKGHPACYWEHISSRNLQISIICLFVCELKWHGGNVLTTEQAHDVPRLKKRGRTERLGLCQSKGTHSHYRSIKQRVAASQKCNFFFFFHWRRFNKQIRHK